MKLAGNILTMNADVRQFRALSWQRANEASKGISRLDKRLDSKVEGQVEASLDHSAWFECDVDSKLDALARRIAQLEQEIAQIRLTHGAPQTPGTKRPLSISESVSSKSHCQDPR